LMRRSLGERVGRGTDCHDAREARRFLPRVRLATRERRVLSDTRAFMVRGDMVRFLEGW
jgi:hypothetical protein